MTQLLELAVEAARQLSPEEQDEIARTILELLHGGRDEVYVLSEEERDAIKRSRQAYARGEVATEEQVRAVFAKYS